MWTHWNTCKAVFLAFSKNNDAALFLRMVLSYPANDYGTDSEGTVLDGNLTSLFSLLFFR